MTEFVSADRRHRGGWYLRSATLYLRTLGFRTAVMAHLSLDG